MTTLKSHKARGKGFEPKKVSPRVARVQEIRRSNASGAIPSKKWYQRKPKHTKGEETE